MKSNKTARQSVATEYMPDARAAYEAGMPVSVMRRRFKMSQSEIEDCCPEERETVPQPEGEIGGY